MHAVLMTLALSATPQEVIIRVELQDALRLPSGFVTPPADPLTIYVKAPASMVHQGALNDAGKKAVLAKLYGGPSWMNGNEDGSTYVVKRFDSKVLQSASEAKHGKSTWWYVLKPDGAIDTRGPDFGDPEAPRKPTSLIDHAEKGSVFKTGPKLTDPKLREWLDQQTGVVKLPVTLKRGQVGFTSRGAKCGAVELRCDDTKLGVSLADRARQACGDAATCQLWLIGNWKPGKEPVLSISKVEGAVTANELSEYTFVQVPN